MNSFGMRQPTEDGTTDQIQQQQQQQQHSFLKDKRAWENAIALYQGPDPLDHWWNYICWYENHGHNDPDNKYRETLERCLTLYEHSDYYKQDVRMVRLWLKYIDMQSNPLHFYQVLHQRGVGKQVACFYIDWASYYEAINACKEAEAVYNLAFQEKAQPYADLHHAHSKFIYTKTLNVQTQAQAQNQNQTSIQSQHNRHHSMQQHYNHVESPLPHVHSQTPCNSSGVDSGGGQGHMYRQHISYQLHSQAMNYHQQHHAFQQSQSQFPSQPQQQNHSHQHHLYNHQQQQQQIGQQVQTHNYYHSELHQQQQQQQQQQQSHMLGNTLQYHQRPSVQQTQQHQTNEMFFNRTNTQHHRIDNGLHNNQISANNIKSNQIMLQNNVPIEQQLPAVNVAMLRQRHDKTHEIVVKQEPHQQEQHTHQQYQEQQQQKQQLQQQSHCVTLSPVPGIRLPRKFINCCRNNNETWQPALYLEEPYDPQRVCHYDKNLVYPQGNSVEYSPEEIKARHYLLLRQQQQQSQEQQQQIKIEQQYEDDEQQQDLLEQQISTEQQQQQQQYDSLRHVMQNSNIKIEWNSQNHSQQLKEQQQQQKQQKVELHHQQQEEEVRLHYALNLRSNEEKRDSQIRQVQELQQDLHQQQNHEQHYPTEMEGTTKTHTFYPNEEVIVQNDDDDDDRNVIVVFDEIEDNVDNCEYKDEDGGNNNDNVAEEELIEEDELIESCENDENDNVSNENHTIDELVELDDNENDEQGTDDTNDDYDQDEDGEQLTNKRKFFNSTINTTSNQSKAFNPEDDYSNYDYDDDDDDENNEDEDNDGNDNNHCHVDGNDVNQVDLNSNDKDNDVEEQIEASTIRFRTSSGTHNKTIKIRFKKETPASGNSNTPSAYKIESIYHQSEVKSPNVSGIDRDCATKNNHSFHPYLMVHTSTPKSSSKSQRSKVKSASTYGRIRNAKIKRIETATADTINNVTNYSTNNKFNLVTHRNSNSSSAAENGENDLDNGSLAKINYNFNNNNNSSNNNNNKNKSTKRCYNNDSQLRRGHFDNANYNDNANHSFSSAVALDNSNCSLSSAVDRLNFRDANATLNNSCSQIQQPSIGGTTTSTILGNITDISTYQESSYFTAHSNSNTDAREQRLIKAYETIERHLAKEAIDPFNSELCRALLTKLNFPKHIEEDDGTKSTYKIIHTPLPKVANTRRLNLPYDIQFNIDKEIGRGSYGSVYKATDINSGSVVALKYQKPANMWEIYICDQVLKRISGDILPGFMDISTAIIAPNASLIATEFSPYGSLLDVNNKIRQATTKVMHESLVMHFSAQICNIIYYLHRSKIIHADIKPDNFLLMRVPSSELHYPSLRLIDFGCAIDMTLFPNQTKFRKVIQTDGFTCIQMQEGRAWSYETDLFCIAGTVHVMLFGEYMQLQKRSEKWDIKQKLPRYLKKNVWSQFFGDILNIDSDKLPDLNVLRMVFDEEVAKMDSELQKQMRTLSNILHRR